MIEQYKAIIFDFDGTLVNSEDWVVNAHNHVREGFDLPLWTKDDIFSSSSLSAREMYPQIYGDRADEAMAMLIDYTTKHNLESAKPYDNAEELLRFIQKKNILQGIVSNKRHEPLNEAVDHLNWSSYFGAVIGAGYATRDKPSADPLLAAMKELDTVLTPEDILYVGDTETDLLCAKNVDCDAALIQSDKPRPDLIEKYKPKLHCFDLISLLKQLESAQNAA